MTVVDTTVWGYVASQPIDILRILRGWYVITISYYTNNSGLSKKVTHTIEKVININ